MQTPRARVDQCCCTAQSSSITWVLPSDCWVSHQKTCFWVVVSYLSAEIQSSSFPASADWAKFYLIIIICKIISNIFYPIIILFKQIDLINRWNPNKLAIQLRVDMKILALTLILHSPELEPHHQMQFCVIPRMNSGKSRDWQSS